jgi:hypothetical protein
MGFGPSVSAVDVSLISSRVTTLENETIKRAYYELVSGTSGSIAATSGISILAGQFGSSGNAILSQVDGSNYPTFTSPTDVGGSAVTATLNATTGDWTSSATYTQATVAIFFVVSGSVKDINSFETASASYIQLIDVENDATLVGSTFSDSSFRVQDNGDATKQLAFEVSGVTTGTTRTITAVNYSGTSVLSNGALTASRVPFMSAAGLIDSSFFTFSTTTGIFVSANGGLTLNSTSGTTLIDFQSSGARSGLFAVDSTTCYFTGYGGRDFSFYQNDGTFKQRFIVKNSGNVGIGLNLTPTAKLHIEAGTATTGTGPIKFSLPGVPLTTREAGVMETSAEKLFYTPTSLARQALPGVLFTQTADKTVTNTTSETSIVGTGVGSLATDMTLPANFFIAGKTIRLRIGGVYSTPAATIPSVLIKVKYGSTVVATVTTTALLAGATSLEFDGEILITCRSTGGSGAVMVHGDIEYATGVGGTISVDPLNNGGATTTIDTTAASLIDVTVTWDAASVTRIVKSTITTMEVLN